MRAHCHGGITGSAWLSLAVVSFSTTAPPLSAASGPHVRPLAAAPDPIEPQWLSHDTHSHSTLAMQPVYFCFPISKIQESLMVISKRHCTSPTTTFIMSWKCPFTEQMLVCLVGSFCTRFKNTVPDFYWQTAKYGCIIITQVQPRFV